MTGESPFVPERLPGGVIWITGLSGAGKSTLAAAVARGLACPPVVLDGDELREVLGAASSGFDSESRRALAFTYARLGRLLASQGHVAVCATISLFHAVRAWSRESIPHYFEVFLDVGEEERRRRDPKGLYRRQAAGDLPAMMGADLLPELPESPDMVFTERDGLSPEAMALRVIEAVCQAWRPDGGGRP